MFFLDVPVSMGVRSPFSVILEKDLIFGDGAEILGWNSTVCGEYIPTATAAKEDGDAAKNLKGDEERRAKDDEEREAAKMRMLDEKEEKELQNLVVAGMEENIRLREAQELRDGKEEKEEQVEKEEKELGMEENIRLREAQELRDGKEEKEEQVEKEEKELGMEENTRLREAQELRDGKEEKEEDEKDLGELWNLVVAVGNKTPWAQWEETCDCSDVHSLVYLNSLFTVLTSVSSSIINICSSANQGRLKLTKENRCLLQFLNDTISLISSLVSSQSKEIQQFATFIIFTQIIIFRARDVLETLQKIERGKATITDNFDIFELKLREHLEEMRSYFPPGATSFVSPLSIISSKEARVEWEEAFGEVYYVTFDKLIPMIETIIPKGTCLSGHMKLCLRYLLDFPMGGVVTTYKFNQLISLFGYENFLQNFEHLTKRKGFCGLVNRIQAYKILTMTSHPNPLLIRLSRTEPRFLAFSYIGKDGKVFHRLNKDSKGHPIQVEKFIQRYFSGYQLVDKQLDLQKIFGGSSDSSMSAYADSNDGYFA